TASHQEGPSRSGRCRNQQGRLGTEAWTLREGIESTRSARRSSPVEVPTLVGTRPAEAGRSTGKGGRGPAPLLKCEVRSSREEGRSSSFFIRTSNFALHLFRHVWALPPSAA